MYAERVEGIRATRYVPFERDGTLTLRVRRDCLPFDLDDTRTLRVVKGDAAATVRLWALVLCVLGVSVPLLMAYLSPSPLTEVLAMIPAMLAVLLLIRSRQRFARDAGAPNHSAFRRVRRCLVIRRGGDVDGYRDGSANGAIVIDDVEVRDLRAVVVLVIVTEERGKNGILRETDFAPTMLLGAVAYELDRFAKKEDAQALANIVSSACLGGEAVAAVEECPPWNPYREGPLRGLVSAAEIFLWVLALLLSPEHPLRGFGPVPRAVLIGFMVIALSIDIAMASADGRRIGKLRTGLVRSLIPSLD